MATIFIKYIYWHFTIAPGQILIIMNNYAKSTWHKFLIGKHFKTLFAPWHRQEPSQLASAKSKNFGDKILDSIIDAYIRLIAAVIRLCVITAGLIMEAATYIGSLIFLGLWLIWPLAALVCVIYGLGFLL